MTHTIANCETLGFGNFYFYPFLSLIYFNPDFGQPPTQLLPMLR